MTSPLSVTDGVDIITGTKKKKKSLRMHTQFVFLRRKCQHCGKVKRINLQVVQISVCTDANICLSDMKKKKKENK